MRRLLRFGTVMLLIAAFIVPLMEFFSNTGTRRISNDTEYAIYALAFAICLVLLVCKLISSGALKFGFISCQVLLLNDRAKPVEARHAFIFAVPPLFVLPSTNLTSREMSLHGRARLGVVLSLTLA